MYQSVPKIEFNLKHFLQWRNCKIHDIPLKDPTLIPSASFDANLFQTTGYL